MQNNGPHIISFNIRLSDLKERERSLFEISDLMRKDLENIPTIRKSSVVVGGGHMMGGQSTIDLEIYGYDFFETDKIAKTMSEKMAEIPGLVDIKISREDYQPEFRVQFDREKLAINGLDIATASNFLRNRVNGLVASLFREDGEEYDIRVAYAPEFRQSIEAIENILIYNNQGQSVRIKDVGKVVEEFSPPTIERRNRQRLITVSSTISGTTMDKAVAAINKSVDELNLPSNIYTQIGGSYLDQQESFADLTTLLLLILLLVFIVMASQFESLTYPFIIMFSVPFAVSGVIIALLITNTNFNMMSFIGVIMLAGIVVKNGIVLVDYINLNRGRGMGIIQAVINGGKSRLRPVLMTTITTILGMTPLAISTSEGSEMWKPMAVTVIGGLTISTIFTLVIVPTVYASFAKNGVKRQRRKLRKQLTTKNDKLEQRTKTKE
jgi:HAE1 family hydrophobic/amphiphilic exporter-1